MALTAPQPVAQRRASLQIGKEDSYGNENAWYRWSPCFRDGPRLHADVEFAGPKTSTDEEGIATIQAALDSGINFLNTGDFYGMGHNEHLAGQAIKGRRDQALISVKFGALRPPSGKMLGTDVRPNAVKNFAAYSLQRLGVDVIDIYVRALGIGLVAYGVVGQGLLTGSVTNDLPANDFRRQFPKFDQENLSKNLEKVSLLERIAHEKNCTTTQLAIAWVVSGGEDVVPLVGMSRPERVAENLRAFDVTLAKEDLDDLDRTFALGAIKGDNTKARSGCSASS